ncbi:MAG: FAD-dependent oxidoreductase [Acidimicrobiales bacterium]
MTIPASTDVVIAGGGPVGLATAVELSFHGVSCVVIERRPEVSWLRPRAKTTSARTMEHFRRWGLADKIRSRAGLPVSWSHQAVFCTTLLGREITRIDECFGLELDGAELVAECGQQVAQPAVEQVLRDALSATPGVRLLTGVELISVAETDGGVFVEAKDSSGQTLGINARYVVGCEGARSVVRDAIGARYEGSDDSRPNFNIVFRAPTLGTLVPHGPAIHYWILNPDQPGLVGRLDLVDLWWCIAQGVDFAAAETDPQRLVHNLLGAAMPVEVLATDAWRARMLLADHYSSDRMFIAGDAAHQNPPWGGHGFNTGIGDAVNIGWKLAAVINGWAPRALLDTYAAERRPVAIGTIDEAVRNMSTLSADLSDPRLTGTDAEFDEARPGVAAAIHEAKDSEFHSLALTLGYNYQDSPIVASESARSTPPDPTGRTYYPTAAPGHRLPHRWVGPGDSLFDHLGRGFSLLGDVSGPDGAIFAAEACTLGVPLKLVDLRGPHWRDCLGADLVLVRPDQHVAWRGAPTTNAAPILRRAIGATPPKDTP